MRTLAATFSTRDEAEAASRRLEGIGIGHERITLKEVEHAADAPAGSGAGMVFLSVKVTTDQVQPATEILKSRRMADDAAVPAFHTLAEDEPVEAPRAELPHRPLPRHQPEPGPVPVFGDIPSPPEPAPAKRPASERGRLGRSLVMYGLALVAAFIVGAWLGLAT